MQVTTSIWSRSLNRLFGKSPSTGTRSNTSRRSTTRRLVLESLERREVFSTDLISAQSLGNSTGGSGANDIVVDTAGNTYMTGYFSGTVDFDPSAIDLNPTARGTRDAFVAKFDSNNSLMWATRMGGDSNNAGGTDVFVVKLTATGSFGWSESFGGTRDDGGSGIAVDTAGDVYLAGYYYGTVDFDPTTGTYYLPNLGLHSRSPKKVH